jgi:hypothetical protein
MKRFDSRWETLVSIIVWVLIIAIVIWSIAKILSIQYTIEDDYLRNQTLFLLTNNATNIVKKVDTSNIAENETFSIYKDVLNQNFIVMTWSNVEPYKYIDRRGNWVAHTGAFQGTIYTQRMLLDKNGAFPIQKQVVKWEIRELIRK